MIESCDKCQFYDQDDDERGLCRRYAPRPVLRQDTPKEPVVLGLWPTVNAWEQCGEGHP